MSNNQYRIFSVPNMITAMGLLSGTMAVVYAFENPLKLTYAAYFIGIAAIFDFLDGFFARLLKQQSALGKELDSLADLVSFGVAPAAIIYQLMKRSLSVKSFSLNMPWGTPELWPTIGSTLLLLSPLLVVVFAALRLAKFNVDHRQTNSFMGLPTPAAALLIASLPFLKGFDPDHLIIISDLFQIKTNFYVLLSIIGFQVVVMESFYFYLPIIIFVCIMMVVEMPLFSLKFKDLSWKNNRLRFVFLSISLFLILGLQALALPLIVLMYIFFSLLKIIVKSLENKNLPKAIPEADGFVDL